MKTILIYLVFLNDFFHKNMLKCGIKLHCCCFNDFICKDQFIKKQLNLFYYTNNYHNFETLKQFIPDHKNIEFFYKDKKINIDLNDKEVKIDDSTITIFLEDISLNNF